MKTNHSSKSVLSNLMFFIGLLVAIGVAALLFLLASAEVPSVTYIFAAVVSIMLLMLAFAIWRKTPTTLKSYLISAIAISLIFIIVYPLIAHNKVDTLFPFLGGVSFKGYTTGIFILICINIIMATSLNFSTGFLGQLVLGHAGFMAIGAYTTALIANILFAFGLPVFFVIVLSLIAGGILAGISGILIGIPALRLRGDYLAIMTLAFAEIVRIVINNLEFTGGAQGLTGFASAQLMQMSKHEFSAYVYFVMVACVAFLVLLARSRHGRAIISIRENEIAAESVGVNSTKYKVTGFAISAMIGGIGGGLFAFHMGFLQPSMFGFMKSVDILVMVVLGGMGSMTGSVAAAGVFTWLPELLRDFDEYRMVAYAVLLIVVMIVRPQGLLGVKELSLAKPLRKMRAKFRKQSGEEVVEGGDE